MGSRDWDLLCFLKRNADSDLILVGSTIVNGVAASLHKKLNSFFHSANI